MHHLAEDVVRSRVLPSGADANPARREDEYGPRLRDTGQIKEVRVDALGSRSPDDDQPVRELFHQPDPARLVEVFSHGSYRLL